MNFKKKILEVILTSKRLTFKLFSEETGISNPTEDMIEDPSHLINPSNLIDPSQLFNPSPIISSLHLVDPTEMINPTKILKIEHFADLEDSADPSDPADPSDDPTNDLDFPGDEDYQEVVEFPTLAGNEEEGTDQVYQQEDFHQNTFEGKEAFMCDKCAYFALDKSTLKRHKSIVHSGNKMLVCDFCNFLATTQSALNNHKKTKHPILTFSCPRCAFTGKSNAELRRHVKRVHQECGIPFSCDECGHVFASHKRLGLHKQVEHNLVRFPCDECDYIAGDSYNLGRHHRRKHQNIALPCDQCDYVARDEHALKHHKKSKHYIF